MIKVDARGCACPIPVIKTKKALASDNSVEVIVDNNTARQNVERFAKGQGATVEVKETEVADEYILSIQK